ncbi:hypothetical protein B0J12DRAFT_682313, partial [Macrophomina phaseolina]
MPCVLGCARVFFGLILCRIGSRSRDRAARTDTPGPSKQRGRAQSMRRITVLSDAGFLVGTERPAGCLTFYLLAATRSSLFPLPTPAQRMSRRRGSWAEWEAAEERESACAS